jgi:hypothetical protein
VGEARAHCVALLQNECGLHRKNKQGESCVAHAHQLGPQHAHASKVNSNNMVHCKANDTPPHGPEAAGAVFTCHVLAFTPGGARQWTRKLRASPQFAGEWSAA